jgi:hypothetical protein
MCTCFRWCNDKQVDGSADTLEYRNGIRNGCCICRIQRDEFDAAKACAKISQRRHARRISACGNDTITAREALAHELDAQRARRAGDECTTS